MSQKFTQENPLGDGVPPKPQGNPNDIFDRLVAPQGDEPKYDPNQIGRRARRAPASHPAPPTAGSQVPPRAAGHRTPPPNPSPSAPAVDADATRAQGSGNPVPHTPGATDTPPPLTRAEARRRRRDLEAAAPAAAAVPTGPGPVGPPAEDSADNFSFGPEGGWVSSLDRSTSPPSPFTPADASLSADAPVDGEGPALRENVPVEGEPDATEPPQHGFPGSMDGAEERPAGFHDSPNHTEPDSGPELEHASHELPDHHEFPDHHDPDHWDDEHYEPAKKKKKGVVGMLVALGVLAAIVALLFAFLRPFLGGSQQAEDYPGPGKGSVTIEVKKGATGTDIAQVLKQENVVASSTKFLQIFQQQKDAQRIAPGEYDFKEEMSAEQALNVLLEPIRQGENSVAVAVNSGFMQKDVFAELSAKMNFSQGELENLAADPTQFGLPAGALNLEGYLAPHLYVLKKDITAKEAIQTMVDRQMKVLTDLGVSDKAQQFRIITIASLIQKESPAGEYEKTAGAIMNRLAPTNTETNGLLQLDSTVGYGLGDVKIATSDEQRQDPGNPYNTYVHPGLPPGPISNPSKAAIEAAQNPEKNDYLYWVTVNPETGETVYTKTFAEHQVYVEKFNEWCTANTAKCTQSGK